VIFVDAILPPKPPEEGLETETESIKEETTNNTIEKPKKKGFLSGIFKKKEKIVENEPHNFEEELPSFETPGPKPLFDSIPKEPIKPKKKPKAKTKNTQDDMENIRVALGITKNTNKKSFQKEFEDHVEKQSKKEKIKKIAKKTTNKIVKKTANRKEKIKPITTKPKITNEKLTELSNKLEANKQDMLKDALSRKPSIIKTREKISNEHETAKKEITNFFKEEKKKFTSQIKDLKTKNKLETQKLHKEIADFEKRELKVNKLDEKLSKKEQTLKNKEIKLNKQLKTMEKFSKEIDTLDASLSKTKKELKNKKEELAAVKVQLASVKAEFTKEKKAISKDKLTLQAEIKAKLAELETTNTNLNKLNKKIETKQKAFEKEEVRIDKKRIELNKLLDEQKRVYDFLKEKDEHAEEKMVEKNTWTDTNKESSSLEDIGFEDESVEKDINDKIEDCRQLIKEENFDDAKILYNEIRAEFIETGSNEPNAAQIQVHIKELYDDICKSLL